MNILRKLFWVNKYPLKVITMTLNISQIDKYPNPFVA